MAWGLLNQAGVEDADAALGPRDVRTVLFPRKDFRWLDTIVKNAGSERNMITTQVLFWVGCGDGMQTGVPDGKPTWHRYRPMKEGSWLTHTTLRNSNEALANSQCPPNTRGRKPSPRWHRGPCVPQAKLRERSLIARATCRSLSTGMCARGRVSSIDLRYDEALRMADTKLTYRIAVRETARQHRVYATLMPKPLFGRNGSGMHVHRSLFKGDANSFFDPADPFHLSKTAKCYVAGILRHATEIIAITNQWVNSYKRLVPGFEAPVCMACARRNRSTMVRIPMYKPGKEKATRIEFRAPDPACNPYLAFAVMLAAGLAGIENGYELPDPV
jgi:hypothetical protein